MPSNMDVFDLEPQEGRDLLEREERCRKARKTVSKAIFMRLLVCILLIWIAFQTATEPWVLGMLALVLLINAAGILPLVQEWKKRRAEWQQLLSEEDQMP